MALVLVDKGSGGTGYVESKNEGEGVDQALVNHWPDGNASRSRTKRGRILEEEDNGYEIGKRVGFRMEINGRGKSRALSLGVDSLWGEKNTENRLKPV